MNNQADCQQSNIEGTPTIRYNDINSSIFDDFSKERTLYNLTEFIDSKISNESIDKQLTGHLPLNIHSDIHSNKQRSTLVLYYASWCPYCKAFIQTWDKLNSLNLNIQPKKVQVDNRNDWGKYKIKTVPTIDLITDDTVYRYNSDDRSLENLTNFIKNPEQGVNNIQTGGNSPNSIMLFYADWCGHCQNFKPIWEDIKNTNLNINFKQFNEGVDVDEIKKYGIEGFPTIILETDNGLHRFEESRTKSNLIKFIKQYT